MNNKSQYHLSGISYNHKKNLKGKMPYGYRQVLSKRFKISPVAVDKILCGERKDYYGVIQEAYKVCIDFNENSINKTIEIERLIRRVSKIPKQK